MKTAVVNIRMEPTLKQEAAEIFSESGLSFSDAITAFCRETVNRQVIPIHFTARRNNPADVSSLTKKELWAKIKESEKEEFEPFEIAMTNFEKEHGLNEAI